MRNILDYNQIIITNQLKIQIIFSHYNPLHKYM